MIERFEPTQERLLEAMHILEFTLEQIQENRRRHGGELFLSDDVAFAILSDGSFGVGVSVDPTTGEMVLSQVAEDLGSLMRAFDDMVDQAYAKFNDPLTNPDHVEAMMEFRAFLSGRAEEFSADLAPYDQLARPHDYDKSEVTR
jgi:hypothetical protein